MKLPVHDENLFQLSLFDQDEHGAPPQEPHQLQSLAKQAMPFVKELSSVGGMPIYLNPRANRHIYLDQCCIAYELQYKRRRNMALHVSAEGVSVSVPRWVGQQEIEQFLKEKSRWLLRKLKEQQDRHHREDALRIRWEDGGELTYLGQKIVLRLQPESQDICLKDEGAGRVLCVGDRDRHADPAELRETVQQWMKQQAMQLFEKRCAYYADIMKVCPQQIRLTSAATRWGSATTQGVIRLHWRLIEMPPELIDYVVVHELAHLHEMNHSLRFWNWVAQVLPDYKEQRKLLKNRVMLTW